MEAEKQKEDQLLYLEDENFYSATDVSVAKNAFKWLRELVIHLYDDVCI